MVTRFLVGGLLFGLVVLQATYNKDRVLQVLETAQNWLEQPSVDRTGHINTDLYGKALSYTLRGSCADNVACILQASLTILLCTQQLRAA